MDKDTLRKYYFSHSSNFSTFKKAQEKRGDGDKRSHSDVAASSVSLSSIDASIPISEPVKPSEVVAAVQSPAVHPSSSAGLAINAVRASQNKSTTAPKSGPLPDAVSHEYFNFLKQQQELQKQHNTLADAISNLQNTRRNQQSEIMKLRRQAKELILEIEAQSDWKLKSKYDVQSLIRDCSLALQPSELVGDVAPDYTGISQLSALLGKLKQTNAQSESYKPYDLFTEQAIRRLNTLERILAQSNMDATSIARIPDTMIIELEQVIALPTIESLIGAYENATEVELFKVDEAKKAREVAVTEGEVHIAEKLCYEIIAHYETMLDNVIRKAGTLNNAIDNNSVVESVREQYHRKTFDEFETIRVRCKKLRGRCEEDIKKIFSLREKVESVEEQTAKKVLEERAKSDQVLSENTQKMDALFLKIAELEKEFESLERERHREIQKRIAEKDKDEHRRAEFAKFCQVVDDHIQPLERTIRNMDVTMQATEVVQEMVNQGFETLHSDLARRDKLLRVAKLETHKEHVEVFRGMLLELGQVVYKKERMIEETEKSIRQAHIQQELLAETFNPNAKKFGDVKKSLLQTRDELEMDVKELRDRATAAKVSFGPTEKALHEQGVAFVHPVDEQQQQELATKARMIEYKALAVGHLHGQSMLEEIASLQQSVDSTLNDVQRLNASTTGVVARTVPVVRSTLRSMTK